MTHWPRSWSPGARWTTCGWGSAGRGNYRPAAAGPAGPGPPAAPHPHVVRFEPPGPGVVLVCSDGLWNYRPDAAGLAELALPAALTDPLGAAAELVKFALDAGGMDNITVVLAPFPLAPFPAEPPHPKTVSVRRVATL